MTARPLKVSVRLGSIVCFRVKDSQVRCEEIESRVACSLLALLPTHDEAVADRRMHIRRARVPPAFLKCLSRPFTEAGGRRSSSSASKKHVQDHNYILRQRLAAYYRRSEPAAPDLLAADDEQGDDHYWRQSGQVLRWIGDHVAKDRTLTHAKSMVCKENLHRQLVAEKVSRLLDHEPLAYVIGE